jgi:DNA-directed RNA polymerase subunit RPC12/RpoP
MSSAECLDCGASFDTDRETEADVPTDTKRCPSCGSKKTATVDSDETSTFDGVKVSVTVQINTE